MLQTFLAMSNSSEEGDRDHNEDDEYDDNKEDIEDQDESVDEWSTDTEKATFRSCR